MAAYRIEHCRGGLRGAEIVVVLLFLAGGASLCAAQAGTAALTESHAVEQALNGPAFRSMQAGTLEAAEGEILQAGMLPNPVLGLERQRLGGRADEREATYGISQRFELGGKRSLRIDAATARLSASQADMLARRQAFANEVRRRFHTVLATQATVLALEDWERRLREVEALTRTLHKGGEVAGFDRRRVERERATATSRANVVRAELGRTLEALRALVGGDTAASRQLSGTLLPEPPGPLDSYLAALGSRADLRALSDRAQALAYDERLARQSRIPDLTLTAGVRQVDRGPLSDSGLVVGVAIPLPIFERGEGGSRRAAGQARATAAERELALARAHGEVRGLWRQVSLLRSAAQEFRREAVAGSQRLAEIARSAYRGGEAGVLELLDAHRGLGEAETRALELELAARVAMLELELVSGGERQ